MHKFKCVNCGEPAPALYKTYGPTVLKLTKCVKCKGVVDKYIEYDPVIVIIDLVLLTKEAQRHILYNTEFKSFWKLFIILIMLETYGMWRKDSLLNIAINSLCGIKSNTTINLPKLDIPVMISWPESWKNNCWAWVPEERDDIADLFIWEKTFYIESVATFTSAVALMVTVCGLMSIMKCFIALNDVSAARALKAFSLAHVSAVASLPVLVWGHDAAALTHHVLAAAYSAANAAPLAAVLYECSVMLTLPVIVVGYCAKYATYFFVTPYLKAFIS
ncbi:hypothetical protein ACJJTC_011482 [Scirpophaga incertulas]